MGTLDLGPRDAGKGEGEELSQKLKTGFVVYCYIVIGYRKVALDVWPKGSRILR